MGKHKQDKAMIKLNMAYLRYVNESAYWKLKSNSDIEAEFIGPRLLEPSYFLEDVLPKMAHGSQWFNVTADTMTDCVIQIHGLVLSAAKDLDTDPYTLLDYFFETQQHVPKKDAYILGQMHDIVSKRIENMKLTPPAAVRTSGGTDV